MNSEINAETAANELKKEAAALALSDGQKERMIRALQTARAPEKQKRNYRPAVAVAACFCAVLAVVLWRTVGGKNRIPAAPVGEGTEATAAAPTEKSPAAYNGPMDPAAQPTEPQPTEPLPTGAQTPTEYHGINQPVTPQADPSQPAAQQDTSGVVHGVYLGPGDEPPVYRTLVESYGNFAPQTYYAVPGTYTVSPALAAACAEYGSDNVTYRLRITVVKDGLDRMTPEEQRAFYLAESDRMRDWNKLNFTVETFEDHNTGEEVVTFGALMYDPTFLESFPARADCWYLIELYNEASEIE